MTLEEFLKLFPQGQAKRPHKHAVELHSRTDHSPQAPDVARFSGEPLPTSDDPQLPRHVTTPTQQQVAKYVEDLRKRNAEEQAKRAAYARAAYEERLAEAARYRQTLYGGGVDKVTENLQLVEQQRAAMGLPPLVEQPPVVVDRMDQPVSNTRTKKPTGAVKR